MDISLIVATDLNGGIGKDGNMPWNMSLKKDLALFKGKTTNNNIIMGRKTMESLPKGFLPNRKNIVLSNKNITNENVTIVNTIENAIEACDDNKEIYIIGGESIYNQFIDKADKIFLTKIQSEFDCDTYFPEINDDWYCNFQSSIMKDGDYDVQFYVYYKKDKKHNDRYN